MNLQSSTLKDDESGEPLHGQQRKQSEAFRDGWKKARHRRTPRVSVSRSIFPLTGDRDLAYFGREKHDRDQVGFIDANTRAVFGRSCVGEPDILVKQLAADEGIATADTLLITFPNTLGVDYNAHIIESVLKYVAPGARLAINRQVTNCIRFFGRFRRKPAPSNIPARTTFYRGISKNRLVLIGFRKICAQVDLTFGAREIRSENYVSSASVASEGT